MHDAANKRHSVIRLEARFDHLCTASLMLTRVFIFFSVPLKQFQNLIGLGRQLKTDKANLLTDDGDRHVLGTSLVPHCCGMDLR